MVRKRNLCMFISVVLSTTLMFFACSLDNKPSSPNPYLPTNVEMVINHDSATTRDTVLSVNLQAENTHWMQIGLDSFLASADWEEFDTLKIVHVQRAEGRVFVYGRLASFSGGTTGVISDDILLDLSASINRVEVSAQDDTLRAGDVIEFSVESGESGKAYVSITNIRLIYPLDTVGVGLFKKSLIVPSGVNEDDVIVTAHFTDEVGNEAEPFEVNRRFVICGPKFNLRKRSFPLEDVLGWDIWYNAGYCFVCDTHSVELVDVTNPIHPIRKRSIYSGEWSNGLIGNEKILFVPYHSGLAVLGVENPDQARVIERTHINDPARDVVIDGRFAYVSCLSQGLKVFEIMSEYKPILIGELRLDGYGEHICISEDIVYIVGWDKGFVIDVTDPTEPVQMSLFNVTGDPQDFLYYENHLLIATKQNGIFVFDVTNPYNPYLVSEHAEIPQTYSLALSPPFLYAGGNGNIRVLNITDFLELGEIVRLDGFGKVNGLFATDDYLYASQACSLSIVELFSDNY